MIMGVSIRELFKLLKNNLIGDPRLELAKFELIQRCKTVEELQTAANFVMEDTPYKNRCIFTPEERAEAIKEIIENDYPCNVLTKAYGIRQQALYIKERIKTR